MSSTLRKYYSPKMIHSLNTPITPDISAWVFLHIVIGMICGLTPIELKTFIVFHTMYELFEYHDLTQNATSEKIEWNMKDFAIETIGAIAGFTCAKSYPVFSIIASGLFLMIIN